MGGHSAEELERLLRRHIEVEADYAVLKHRLWLALQDNQVMSLRDGSLSKSVRSLERVIDKLHSYLAQLQAENTSLRSQTMADSTPGPADPAGAPRSLRKRLSRFWPR
jgi:cell division protein FtsB